MYLADSHARTLVDLFKSTCYPPNLTRALREMFEDLEATRLIFVIPYSECSALFRLSHMMVIARLPSSRTASIAMKALAGQRFVA